VLAKRIDFLTQYQNVAYARQYSDFVAQVRRAEAALGEPARAMKLTTAVATYLFKLMAYKDEYEVARLYTAPAFREKITGMFEGDYQLKFHLAPPLLAKHDANGHLIKKEYGPWMMRAFGVLARLRFLRGTPLDVFGYTAERKQERDLIGEYCKTVSGLLDKLNAANLAQAVAIARIPEEIRGYGHVKQRHLKAARQKEADLLRMFAAGQKPNVPEGGKQAA
jgi:indolepyruvate ferredoxin oxidoreductase